MTQEQQHPITPPPKLVEKWYDLIPGKSTDWKRQLCTKAAQWGADQELEALLVWLRVKGFNNLASDLLSARRSKPLTPSAAHWRPSMTKQHKATPEQWETIEKYADSVGYACILELRGRIEALEAAQQPPQDKLDRLIALDRDDPAATNLAARPLLEKVARMGDHIGQHTVGEIIAISNQAEAWLNGNPPGQPVAIEPQGCPTPGACSCVEPAAQPEPKGPSDQEIEEWADACFEAPLEELDPEIHGWRRCFTAQEFSETIRAALARWGTPANNTGGTH